MSEHVFLLEDYRRAVRDLQEALTQNHAPRVLALVLRQNEILQRIRVQYEADPRIRPEVSRALHGLAEELQQNERLLSQVSEVFNTCVKELARVHNNLYLRQQV